MTTEQTDSATFDAKLACFTFEALERCAALAATEGEMEIAAEYTDTLFYISDQMPEFWRTFIEESDAYGTERGEGYERHVNHAMQHVEEWSRENDHSVVEWFDRAREGMPDE